MTQIEIENRPAFGYNKATEAKKRQAKESGESAMFTLLILADDFTGALDTGVQISKTGAKTVVLTDPHADLERFADGTDVLVIDAETRHISPQQAKECVASIVRRAFALNVPCIYKRRIPRSGATSEPSWKQWQSKAQKGSCSSCRPFPR